MIEHLDHLAIGLEQLHVLERALALDPSNVDAAAELGIDYRFLGEFDKSFEYFDKAIRASPNDPLVVYWYAGKASANFGLKRYEIHPDDAEAIGASAAELAHGVWRSFGSWSPTSSGTVRGSHRYTGRDRTGAA